MIFKLQKLKPWMLPLSMLGGIVLHDYIGMIAFVAPYLIFIMLFITFCRITPRELKIDAMTWSLLAVQIVGSIVVYYLCLPLGGAIAQSAFICVFCPTATAAPVITGMLGGSVPRLATFSIFSNLAVAILGPLLLSEFGINHTIDVVALVSSTLTIARRVAPLIIMPLLAAIVLYWLFPKTHHRIGDRQSVSFYIWALSLFIVVGNAVSFVMSEPASAIPRMLTIALVSCVMCLLQFGIGRLVGARCGDRIAGAQGLGQKNTVLAIWMALTWLDPIASVGPAAYVAWQNIINSTQIYFRSKKTAI